MTSAMLDERQLRPVPRPSGAERALERFRVRAVERSGLLDTDDEERFDRLTRTARDMLGTAAAGIALIGDDRQYLKSMIGPMKRHLARDIAFCSITVKKQDALVVPDMRLHPILMTHPFVQGAPFVRSYAGLPLRGSGGWFIGSFCVLDTEPREFSPGELAALQRLADEAEYELNAPL